MEKKSVIKSLLAQCLLLLFVFSITPRIYLHDLFANHLDMAASGAHHDDDQLTATGFRCDIHDQVAESPFMSWHCPFTIEPPLLFPTTTTQYRTANLRLQVPPSTDLRGPPAVA